MAVTSAGSQPNPERIHGEPKVSERQVVVMMMMMMEMMMKIMMMLVEQQEKHE